MTTAVRGDIYIRCVQCGERHRTSGMSSNHATYICQDCRQLNRIQRERLRSSYRKPRRNDYRIIYTTDDDTFRPGAFFCYDEMQDLLQAGYLEPGTIIERYGIRYVVCGEMYEKQKIERVIL